MPKSTINSELRTKAIIWSHENRDLLKDKKLEEIVTLISTLLGVECKASSVTRILKLAEVDYAKTASGRKPAGDIDSLQGQIKELQQQVAKLEDFAEKVRLFVKNDLDADIESARQIKITLDGNRL